MRNKSQNIEKNINNVAGNVVRSYYFNYFSKTYHSTELKEFIDISRKAQSFHPDVVCLLFDNYVVYAVCCSTTCFGK